MLKEIRAMFGNAKTAIKTEDRPPLAIAALLVEAACVDEAYTDKEKSLIDAMLGAQFGLSEAEARGLRREAEIAQSEAADLHRFTKIVKTAGAAEKVRLIERLWTIVLSDGDRDPHEDTLIRRVCGLIYVSDLESGAARQRAEEALRAR